MHTTSSVYFRSHGTCRAPDGIAQRVHAKLVVDGVDDGAMVGSEEGALVGMIEGASVGSADGAIVGRGEGRNVGTGVGNPAIKMFALSAVYRAEQYTYPVKVRPQNPLEWDRLKVYD